MIISASRRTDIPAFYAAWFVKRIEAGYCTVPNPFNRNQVSRVSLRCEDVDVIVFWTRNPAPLMPYLHKLDERGYRYYFQYTLMANPRAIDPKSPSPHVAVETFRALAEMVGPQRVIWRYDPIVLSAETPPAFHVETHARLAEALHGAAGRCVVSLVDVYRKAGKRLKELERKGIAIEDTPQDALAGEIGEMLSSMAATAKAHGMESVSCAEELDLSPFGIAAGKCVDDDYILRVFGLDVSHKKDPGQREACGCVVSRDIGMYDSCLFGCQYCYATADFQRAAKNYKEQEKHSDNSQSLLGNYDAPETEKQPAPKKRARKQAQAVQGSLLFDSPTPTEETK